MKNASSTTTSCSTARPPIDLYERFARRQPIIDYHCHLSPHQIADDHRWRSITEIWLEGDHYKWRAMRTAGVPERSITGDASDWDKFAAWAATVPQTLRNPLYHWTHLELKFPFGVSGKLLGPDTAQARSTSTATASWPRRSSRRRGCSRSTTCKVVCSTDDPVDDLEPHRRHAKNAGAHQAEPDLASRQGAGGARPRPVERVGRQARRRRRHDHRQAGEPARGAAEAARLLPRQRLPRLRPRARAHLRRALHRARGGGDLRARRARARRWRPTRSRSSAPALTYDFAVMDHKRGWVQQFHLGAMRNNSTRAMRLLGPDTGYDAVGDFPQGESLVRFLDRLDSEGQLAKTIVYNLNPRDNELLDHDHRLVPGRFGAGQDAVRQRLVVPRSARRHGKADERAVQHGPAVALRRHADRLAQLPVVLAPRLLPPAAVQPARQRRRRGPAAQRAGAARPPGRGRLLQERARVLRLRDRRQTANRASPRVRRGSPAARRAATTGRGRAPGCARRGRGSGRRPSRSSFRRGRRPRSARTAPG